MMVEYTSLDIGKCLNNAGFKVKGDTVYWEPGDTFKGSGEHIWRYRADTLEQWLFTKASEMIVGAQAGGGFNVNWGINLFVGTGKNLPDAYADVIIQYLEWRKATHALDTV